MTEHNEKSMDDYKTQADTWLEVGYSCMNTPMLPKYQYHVLDRCIRGASDLISCETTSVHTNTASLIQWCKLWSVEALNKYNELWDELTERRNGKPPTHRIVCNERDQNRTRWFTCEHEYPLIIPKKGVRDEGWTLQELKDWMWTYSKVTIILNEENDRLQPYTTDMTLAATRYKTAGIETTPHPQHQS